MRRAAWLWPVVLVATGCATRVFSPPNEPPVPFPEAPRIWEQVTARCRDAQRYVGELRVRGWVGARDQRIAQTMHGAVTRDDDVYLELRVLGGSVFQMAGQAGEATFMLPRDERVLRAPQRDIVAALTGLRWGGRELLDVLSGCVAMPASDVTGDRMGSFLRVTLSPNIIAWLREGDGVWQVRAAQIEGWLVDYGMYDGGWPREVRVSSTGATPLDLQFTISQRQVNIDLPPDTFRLVVPGHFQAMTLEELRSIGPLRERETMK